MHAGDGEPSERSEEAGTHVSPLVLHHATSMQDLAVCQALLSAGYQEDCVGFFNRRGRVILSAQSLLGGEQITSRTQLTPSKIERHFLPAYQASVAHC